MGTKGKGRGSMTVNWNGYWRERLIKAAAARNYSPETVKNYALSLRAMVEFKPGHPRRWGQKDIEQFLMKLKTTDKLSAATVNLYRDGLAFFCHAVLRDSACLDGIPRLKENKNLPDVLDPSLIGRLLEGVTNPKHKLALSLAYGCELRVGELAALKVGSIDFLRKIIAIRNGKGGKDRAVMLPESLEKQMREYVSVFKPKTYLFEARVPGEALTRRSFQHVFKKACKKEGIVMEGGIHSLRHSFATHLLENGTDLRYIQVLLGNSSSKTTERYTRVAAHNIVRIKSPVDRIGMV